MAEWFQLPATGTIDTMFWEVLGSVGALDSVVYIRVHQSRIGPDYGPGENGSNPFRAPCQSWGYYKNTNDLDRKVTGFIDDATDTNWVSTIGADALGGALTLPVTIGNSLWGGVLGIQHTQHSGKINYQSMLEYDTLKVNKGDLVWLSQRVKGPAGHTSDDRTEWSASGFRVTLDNENYPSRNWKFYEHDSGPSNCAGHNANSVSRGWVARGGFGDDSLDVAVFNYWYSMTVTSNVPPNVKSTDVVKSTFGNGPFPIESEIEDCDPSSPGTAAVVSAEIQWSRDNVGQPSISMTSGGGNFWDGEIPAQECGHQITYRVKAIDDKGEFGTGAQISFATVCFGSAYYYPDTGAACTTHDISSSGTTIPNNAFFLTPTAATNAVKTDDGTAGPFDVGGNMMLFGDEFRYAWVSINGALSLSKNATDTIDVSANGAYTFSWTFPYLNTLRTARDTSATINGRMPINFITPFWNDLIMADTNNNQFGHIRYQQLSGADSCLFVVQWDSVGAFTTGSTGILDESKYRVVLNRCDGTIEFQYDNVGTLGLDTTALVGMQGQTNAEYIFINQNGAPFETKPRNNWCIKFYPGALCDCIDSWNMVSVAVNPIGGNYAKAALYPGALGPMFAYAGNYVPTDPLLNGPGYWAKLSGAKPVGGRGTLLNTASIPVAGGWNMIGSIGRSIPTSSIGVSGGGTVSSNYFGYGGTGYYVASTNLPGCGYWVKMSGAATLSMNYPSAAPKQSPATDLNAMNRITIIDAAGRQQSLYIGEETTVREPLGFYELPPAVPGFDARYASGRMVETYPASLEKNGVYEYPIVINEAAYPVTVQWNTVKAAGRSLVLSSADGKLGNTVMNGSGALRLTDANVKTVVVRLADVQVPTKYALGQNYPNPFNPTTRFEVSIPKTAYVTVAIYDVLGRQLLNQGGLGGAGQEQFQDQGPGLAHLVRGGLDDEAFLHRVGAGVYQPGAARWADLDHAEPTLALGLEIVMVTESGNIDPLGPGRQQQAQAGLGFYRQAVDGQIDIAHDPTLTASNLQTA